MSSEPYVGAIKMFGFSFAPRGYALCNGQLMSIAQYSALYALLGTAYGGDGRTTFGLPNLQGRVPVHMGTLPGGSTYTIGEMAGTESVTIQQAQMPMHTHAFSSTASLNATSALANSNGPSAGAVLGVGADQEGTDTPQIYAPAGTTANVALGGLNVAATIGVAGGSQPLSILQPFVAVNFSIALVGVYPSRN